MKRVLICPDKFKGSLTAAGVCNALARAMKSVYEELEITSLPLADGGDGSFEIIKRYRKISIKQVKTTDALGRSIQAEYGYEGAVAFIELSKASGLALLNENERNPMMTSTIGTGTLILDARNRGCSTIYLFIGGSATNDAGIGIAHALGYRFLDADGNERPPIGKNLKSIESIIEPRKPVERVRIIVLHDVNNNMYGIDGAAFNYAAQKGANAAEVMHLDEGLRHYAQLLTKKTGRDFQSVPGAGAAGAVAVSLLAFLDAELKNGFEMIAGITGLEDHIKKVDLVVTGEGMIDRTSLKGKVVGNVLDLCKKHRKPCILVAGSAESLNIIPSIPVKTLVEISKDPRLAMDHPKRYLKEIGQAIATEMKT